MRVFRRKEPATGASASTNEPDGWTADAPAEAAVEVPDATSGDGYDAWSAIEDEGLTPIFVDAGDGADFDPYRDGTGCDVVDQRPVAGEMVVEGDEVEIVIDCSQVDWENQDGSDWETFSDAYSQGFNDGCDALFSESPDGSFYEDDYDYTASDCQGLNPGDASSASDLPTEVPDDAESAGGELGELDGCQALFEEQGVWSLNWGEDSYTEDDCPLGGYYAPPEPSTRKKRSGGVLKHAGDSCTGDQADGTPITMQVETGEIDCAGAQALWHEFLRRAPTEGAGSSGYTEFDGWGCAGATLSDAPRYGSCERLDHTAAFAVYDGE